VILKEENLIIITRQNMDINTTKESINQVGFLVHIVVNE